MSENAPVAEIAPREKYRLEGSILSYGFMSNYNGPDRYKVDCENIAKVFESGLINSPNARPEQTDYDNTRYGKGGDIPIDAQRVCFYLWKADDPTGNDNTYVGGGMWIGPVNALEGKVAHADPGDPGDAIGVTSPDERVEITLESGKTVLDYETFVDVYESVVQRAKALGIELGQYLNDNILLVAHDHRGSELRNVKKMTRLASKNITPATRVTARVVPGNAISNQRLQTEDVQPYTAEQLGSSTKMDTNHQWRRTLYKQLVRASRAKYNDVRMLAGLEVIKQVATETEDESLLERAQEAIQYCEHLPYADIF